MKKTPTPTWLLTLFVLIVFQGCYLNNSSEPQNSVQHGYRPVYDTNGESEIKLMSSRTVKNPGKIYVYDNYLLINEINQGIHVFDNLDPENPTSIGFIQLIGNSDMAMRDNVLYADQMGNIVALNFTDFENITKEASLPLKNWKLGIPPPSGFYFECINSEKGIVVDWKQTELKNPSCYAN